MKFSPGEFNTPIEIQQPTVGKDAEGGATTTWIKFTDAMAKKNNLSGNERSATKHGGRVAVSRVEFTTYFQDGITESMRVVCNGKFHNIIHVNNYLERNQWLIITTETGATRG